MLKQWDGTSPRLQINNRLDTKDTQGKWFEARVIELKPSEVKIHYKRFAAKYDEWIPIDSDRLARVSTRCEESYGVN